MRRIWFPYSNTIWCRQRTPHKFEILHLHANADTSSPSHTHTLCYPRIRIQPCICHTCKHTIEHTLTRRHTAVSRLLVFLSFSFSHLIRLAYTPVPKIKAETCTMPYFWNRSDSDRSPYISPSRYGTLTRTHELSCIRIHVNLSNTISMLRNLTILSVLQPIRRLFSLSSYSSNVLCHRSWCS